ncbi:MAG: type II secretion system F family protein [Chlorobium sp.]|nr:type II secretion system F family protein [Chlorobium sp.]
MEHFTEMLLSLLKASMTLSDALQVLAKPGLPDSVQNISVRLLSMMRKGYSFSRSLSEISVNRKYSMYFSKLYISLIAAAEATGKIIPVLEDIHADHEQQKKVRNILISTLIYPAIIIVVALLGTIFIIFKAIPMFVKNSFLSETAAQSAIYGILFAGFFLSAAGLCFFLVFNRLFSKESTEYRIFYFLAFLLREGISIPDALSYCVADLGDTKAGRAILSIKKDITTGLGLSTAFEKANFFSAYVNGWISVADENGNARDVFTNLAKYFNDRDAFRRETASRFIEPALIIITGIYLLILLQSAVLPMLTRAGGLYV